MIDPKIYKDAAAGHEEESGLLLLSRANDCYIGPTWTPLKLRLIRPYNHDTSIFQFELPDPTARLDLPVTAHLLVRAPGCEHGGGDAVRPYTTSSDDNVAGTFCIMVKRYQEWGIPESKQRAEHKVFLYAKTDHSYKPAGAVSNYIHSMTVGQYLEFKHTEQCLGKISYPIDPKVAAITMIAVGVGVVPMVRILRRLKSHNESHVKMVRLLYGVRTVADILYREQLDQWHDDAHHFRSTATTMDFKVCYCVGSRWSNIHFAANTCSKKGPRLPSGWDSIPSDRKELGWVDGDKVHRLGASMSDDEEHRIFICGLPGVYLALAGPRSDPTVEEGTQLYRLGYRDHQVIKF